MPSTGIDRDPLSVADALSTGHRVHLERGGTLTWEQSQETASRSGAQPSEPWRPAGAELSRDLPTSPRPAPLCPGEDALQPLGCSHVVTPWSEAAAHAPGSPLHCVGASRASLLGSQQETKGAAPRLGGALQPMANTLVLWTRQCMCRAGLWITPALSPPPADSRLLGRRENVLEAVHAAPSPGPSLAPALPAQLS